MMHFIITLKLVKGETWTAWLWKTVIDEVMKNFRLDGAFHRLQSLASEVTDLAQVHELFMQNKISIEMGDLMMFKSVTYKRVKNVGNYIYEYYVF